MAQNVRGFISDLGGYRFVALRLGKKPTTVHTHMQAGVLPAAWYDALCDLAREVGQKEPTRATFSFLPLASRKDDAA